MDKLSLEQKQYFLKFCGISEMINLALTSKEWRKSLSDEIFLDEICRQRFGLDFDELPELTEYEKLLINTQQIVLQAKNPTKFFGVHPSLAKIYGMELRASWFPYLFNGSNVNVTKNIIVRDLKYPWPYDQSTNESPFYDETKKLSARIHAAFPNLFETLVDSTRKQYKHGKFGYFTENYPPNIEAIEAAYEETEIDFGLSDRHPKIIQIVTPSGQTLFIFIYEDDESWRVVYLNTGDDPEFDVSDIIKWKAPLEEIRDAVDDVIPDFCDSVEVDESKCPLMGPLETSQAGVHLVQLALVKVLEAAIQTSANTLVQSMVNVEAGKLIKLVDSLYTIRDVEIRPSKKLSIAFCRALRCLVNSAFLQEVKNIYEDPLTYRLIHAWSFQGKGRKRRFCYDTSAPSGFDFKRKCFMRETVSNSICFHRGFADLWPAITLKKAVDQVPKLAEKLHSDTVELISVQSPDGNME